MELPTIQQGKRKLVKIREGEVFCTVQCARACRVCYCGCGCAMAYYCYRVCAIYVCICALRRPPAWSSASHELFQVWLDLVE